MNITELEPKLEQASRLMEMLSHPVRLRVLCLLLEGERSVLSLVDDAGLSQPAISHHLRKLREAELVKTRRDAQTIYYSLNGVEVKSVLSTLHGIYCAD